MFTGIIEETGIVQRIEPTDSGIRLALQSKLCARGLKLGDSLAVNGCCLTVVKLSRARTGRVIEFDLLKETWRRTNLQFMHVGSAVNLERSLPRGRTLRWPLRHRPHRRHGPHHALGADRQ